MTFESWLWDAQEYAEGLGHDWCDLTDIVIQTISYHTVWYKQFEEGLTPKEAVQQVINQLQ